MERITLSDKCFVQPCEPDWWQPPSECRQLGYCRWCPLLDRPTIQSTQQEDARKGSLGVNRHASKVITGQEVEQNALQRQNRKEDEQTGQPGRGALRTRLVHVGHVKPPLAAEFYRRDEAGQNIHRRDDRTGKKRHRREPSREDLAGPNRERRQRKIVSGSRKERLPHQKRNQARNAQNQ